MKTLRASLLVATLAVGCGGASPPAEEPDDPVAEEETAVPAEPADEREPGDAFVLGVRDGSGGLRAREAPPHRPPAPRAPAHRSSATDAPSDPELAEAERAASAAHALPIGTDNVSVDVQTAVAELDRRVTAASEAAQAAVELYRPLLDDPRLGPVARTRSADVYDDLAARMVAATFPLPVELRNQLVEATEEVRAEVESNFHRVIAGVMEAHSTALFCMAVHHYGDAGTPRATDQLTLYGEDFVATCRAHGY